MKIARFEPWSYVDLLHRDLNRSFNRDADSEWSPAVDIIEGNGNFLLRADVPGVSPDDIEVAMDAGILTISGARSSEEYEDSAEVKRAERRYGRFLRRFTLPESVDADRITARISNGILEVAIPKLPEVQPRRITVEAA